MAQSLQKSSSNKPTYGAMDVFHNLKREMDGLFEDFTRGIGWQADGSLVADMLAKLDVTESEDAVSVAVELPGMDEKDIDVTLSGDVLIIKGEKKEKREEKQKDYHLKERSWGSFERRVALPFHADSSKIRADFKKGVLTVSIPKPAEARVSVEKIKIKSSE